jgi:hypothetical protein
MMAKATVSDRMWTSYGITIRSDDRLMHSKLV